MQVENSGTEKVVAKEKKQEKPNMLVQMLLKQLRPVIQEKIKNVDPFFSEEIEKVKLLDNEDYAGFLISSDEHGEAWIFTVTFKHEDIISRIVKKQKATEFLQDLINLI